MTSSPTKLDRFKCLFELPTVDSTHRGVQWHCDRQLLRNLERALVQSPNYTPEKLTYEYLRVLKQKPEDSLTKRHLYAFLSRIAERAVQKLMYQFSGLPAFKGDRIGFLQDLLQDILEYLLDPVYFFKSFNLDYADQQPLPHIALQSYCQKTIRGYAIDTVRKKAGMSDFMRSDLGLARRESQRKTSSALEYVGKSPEQIEQYLLAKKCLKEYSEAVTLDISKYAESDFQQVADRYNNLSNRLPVNQVECLDGDKLKIWLEDIGAALRKFNSRHNNPKQISSDDSESFTAEIPDPSASTAYDFSEQQEWREQNHQLNNFLLSVLQDMKPETNRIPFLMHALSLVQTKIAMELDKNQATIARNYKSFLGELTQKLAVWSHSQFQVPVTSELLSTLRSPIEEQLKPYYTGLLHADVQSSLSQQKPHLITLIQLVQIRIDRILKPQGPAIIQLKSLLDDYT
jgi:hypothetical protein